MTIATPVFLLTFLSLVILMIRAALLALTKRGEKAIRTVKIIALVAMVYMAVLIGVSLTSHRTTLALGQPKCFDDWCFAVDKVTRNPGKITLSVATLNHGRRAQRPDTPRAFLVLDGKTTRVDCPRLTYRIEGFSENPFSIDVPIPPSTKTADFLVTEGGGPSAVIIGDENSPLHAKAVWQLLP